MPVSDVIVKTAPALLLVSHQMTIPRNEQVPDYFDRAHTLLRAFIADHALKVVGPHMTIWHQGPEVVENEVVEVTFEVDRPVPGDDSIRVVALPAVRVVSATHQGPFSEFTSAHTLLTAWMKEHGKKPTGGYREIYHRHDPSNRSDSITEIQILLPDE